MIFLTILTEKRYSVKYKTFVNYFIVFFFLPFFFFFIFIRTWYYIYRISNRRYKFRQDHSLRPSYRMLLPCYPKLRVSVCSGYEMILPRVLQTIFVTKENYFFFFISIKYSSFVKKERKRFCYPLKIPSILHTIFSLFPKQIRIDISIERHRTKLLMRI